MTHHVSPENGLAFHVLEAEFTDVKASQTRVLLGVRRVVPGVQLVPAKQNGLNHVTALSDRSNTLLPAEHLFTRSRLRNPEKKTSWSTNTVYSQMLCSGDTQFAFPNCDFPTTCQGWKAKEHVLVRLAENLLHLRAEDGQMEPVVSTFLRRGTTKHWLLIREKNKAV